MQNYTCDGVAYCWPASKRDFCFRIFCLYRIGQWMAMENSVDRRSPSPSDRICQFPNLSLWTTENPLANWPVPLHSAKVTVWHKFAASFTIGLYFFEGTGAFNSDICTVTGKHYECLLHNNLILALQQHGCIDHFYARWHSSAYYKSSEVTAEVAFWKC